MVKVALFARVMPSTRKRLQELAAAEYLRRGGRHSIGAVLDALLAAR